MSEVWFWIIMVVLMGISMWALWWVTLGVSRDYRREMELQIANNRKAAHG